MDIFTYIKNACHDIIKLGIIKQFSQVNMKVFRTDIEHRGKVLFKECTVLHFTVLGHWVWYSHAYTYLSAFLPTYCVYK